MLNVNHINFFDIEYPEISNDDKRVANDLNKGKSDSSNSSVSSSNINTVDFPVDSGNDADSSDGLVAAQNEEVVTLKENVFSEGNLNKNPSSSQGVQNVRRSSRQSVFPTNYNDFVVESKVKYGIEKYFMSSGEIDRYKARLVAQDFVQKERIDYMETFSPVVKMVTLRCLLNIAMSMSWPVFQLDMNNAFLYGDLEEVVYMKPLEGYFPFDNKVCRLKKSLYGLKQASRQWNAKLTSTLIENGFSQ
ncbi:ribonuclease H-like domain-containing protein, partial [Tanacetum coccineum]